MWYLFSPFEGYINMEDSDEELPTLSADTFAALQQFYKEEVSFVLNLKIWKGDKCK